MSRLKNKYKLFKINFKINECYIPKKINTTYLKQILKETNVISRIKNKYNLFKINFKIAPYTQ
jgi:hypothetical protein